MDDELSANARQLIDFAMDADVPPPVVVEGSWGMVVSRLTLETTPAQRPAPHATELPKARRWGAIALVIVVAAAAALWLARPTEAPPAIGTTAARTAAAPARPATPVRPTVPAVAPAPSPAGLLDDAEAALVTDPTRALAAIDRHAELAPTLEADRRMALRIASLCALGRTDDAEAQATAFLATPRAPEWAARVRASCAGR